MAMFWWKVMVKGLPRSWKTIHSLFTFRTNEYSLKGLAYSEPPFILRFLLTSKNTCLFLTCIVQQRCQMYNWDNVSFFYFISWPQYGGHLIWARPPCSQWMSYLSAAPWARCIETRSIQHGRPRKRSRWIPRVLSFSAGRWRFQSR